MKPLLTLIFVILFDICFGQKPTIISGTIVDENGKPVINAALHYGKDNATQDTSYTGNHGQFKVEYPNPQEFWYYFYVDKNGYLPKTFFIPLSSKHIHLKKPFIIRSRKTFWYDTKQIDSSEIGMPVKDAIKKFKLDTDECILSDEPPGVYRSFHTEFADSSIVNFSFKSFFSTKRPKIADILNLTIRGIGIADTKGNEKTIGKGFTVSNPYYAEKQMLHN